VTDLVCFGILGLMFGVSVLFPTCVVSFARPGALLMLLLCGLRPSTLTLFIPSLSGCGAGFTLYQVGCSDVSRRVVV